MILRFVTMCYLSFVVLPSLRVFTSPIERFNFVMDDVIENVLGALQNVGIELENEGSYAT